jgi:hypothetical protein
MKPKEYEQNVLVTESRDLSAVKDRLTEDAIRLLHAGLGFSSELTELVDAYALPPSGEIDWVNISEESGDLLWYAAVAVNTLGLDHDEVSKHERDLSGLEKHCLPSLKYTLLAAVCVSGDFNDLLKKHIFYGRELDKDKLKLSLKKMCLAASAICFVSGTTVEATREKNIAKLRARYGDKFSEAAALNRDLETERKILEKE